MAAIGSEPESADRELLTLPNDSPQQKEPLTVTPFLNRSGQWSIDSSASTGIPFPEHLQMLKTTGNEIHGPRHPTL